MNLTLCLFTATSKRMFGKQVKVYSLQTLDLHGGECFVSAPGYSPSYFVS